MSDRVVTPKCRLSYPKLLKPELNKMSGKVEFSTTLIFPKDADLGPMLALANAAGVAMWGSDKASWPANRRSPFRRGDEPGKADVEGYGPDVVFTSVKQDPDKGKPRIVGPDLKDVTDPGEVYPGRWCIAAVRAYAYTKGRPGIAFGLVNIQLLDHDTPLGGAGPVDPEDDFVAVKIAGNAAPSAAPAGGKIDPFDV